MRQSLSNEALRRLLREADPASPAPETSRDDVRRMRHKIVREASSPTSTSFAAWALATTCAVLVAAVIVLPGPLPREDQESRSIRESQVIALQPDEAPPDPEEAGIRRVQFTTAGGTRVYWVLNERIDL